MKQIEFLGVEFDDCDLPSALDWVATAKAGARFEFVVTPNVDHVVMLSEHGNEPWRADYRKAVASAGLTLNDSRILQKLARLSGKSLPLAPGSDLVSELIANCTGSTGSIALVGGRSEELHWLRAALPGYSIAHFEPPMGVRDNPHGQEEIASFVEAEKADIVFLAIGAPQSEIVAKAIACRGRARGVALCIGASIEFLSGSKRRAPRWIQHAGLEWLFRLMSEPNRLWRRYLLRGPKVFRLWWSYRATKGPRVEA